jgi:F-type H+-transporting ATPase subunit c
MENEAVQTVSQSAEGIKAIATALAIGLGAIGPAIAIGKLAGSAMEAMGRNPEAASKIQPAMLLAMAFAEAIAVYDGLRKKFPHRKEAQSAHERLKVLRGDKDDLAPKPAPVTKPKAKPSHPPVPKKSPAQ